MPDTLAFLPDIRDPCLIFTSSETLSSPPRDAPWLHSHPHNLTNAVGPSSGASQISTGVAGQSQGHAVRVVFLVGLPSAALGKRQSLENFMGFMARRGKWCGRGRVQTLIRARTPLCSSLLQAAWRGPFGMSRCPV